ncbi:MAG: restriction endonuclease subunit S [Candidatus Arsenophonus phytopathogenicus]
MSKIPLIKLEQVCNILTGYAFKSKFFSELEGFPLIRIRDIKVGFTRTKYNCDDYDPKYIINDGDILIGMDGEFNATIWNGGKALLNQRVALLTPKSGFLKDYLFHTIQKPLKDIENNTSFTTVKHISSKQISKIQIPYLSIKEQLKFIDSIQKKEKEIEILKEKIEDNKQYINEEINKLWQPEREK